METFQMCNVTVHLTDASLTKQSLNKDCFTQRMQLQMQPEMGLAMNSSASSRLVMWGPTSRGSLANLSSKQTLTCPPLQAGH